MRRTSTAYGNTARWKWLTLSIVEGWTGLVLFCRQAIKEFLNFNQTYTQGSID